MPRAPIHNSLEITCEEPFNVDRRHRRIFFSISSSAYRFAFDMEMYLSWFCQFECVFLYILRFYHGHPAIYSMSACTFASFGSSSFVAMEHFCYCAPETVDCIVLCSAPNTGPVYECTVHHFSLSIYDAFDVLLIQFGLNKIKLYKQKRKHTWRERANMWRLASCIECRGHTVLPFWYARKRVRCKSMCYTDLMLRLQQFLGFPFPLSDPRRRSCIRWYLLFFLLLHFTSLSADIVDLHDTYIWPNACECECKKKISIILSSVQPLSVCCVRMAYPKILILMHVVLYCFA